MSGRQPSLYIPAPHLRLRTASLPILVGLLLAGGCSQENTATVDRKAAEPSAAAKQRQAPSPFRFERSKSLAAAEVIYRNGEETRHYSILESLGGGVGITDFDRDGQPDLCFPGGGTIHDRTTDGHPSRLLRQRHADQFEDVTEAAMLDRPRHYSHGCCVGDFNSDGFSDLLITGYGGLTLWTNMGDGTFREETAEAGLTDQAWSSSAAWSDFNGDGALDLYVAHYVDWSFENDPPCIGPSGVKDVCPPRQFEGLDDILYLGNGDGTFRDASSAAGLVPGGKGLGVVTADLEHDGDIDCYVANDTTPNFFYVNTGDATFREEGLASGLALDDMGTPNGSMGLAILDYNDDRLPDLGVSNYEQELFALYRNLGAGAFQHSSRMTGLNRIGNLHVGFGCVTGDFDADGDEEITVANGHVVHHPLNAPVRQYPLLLDNRGGGAFERIEPQQIGGYFNEASLGRGLATGDVDRDGLLDMVFVNTNDPAALLYNRNLSASDGKSLRGLHLRLVGTASARDAFGAWAELVTDAGVQVRHLCGGGSYLSSGEPALHWHWPETAKPQEVRVHWPSGGVSTILWSTFERSGKAVVRAVLVEPSGDDQQPRLHHLNDSPTDS